MAPPLPCSLAVLLALSTPSFAAGPDSVHQGAALFADKGCAHCHGANGMGGKVGPDLARVRERLNANQMAEQIRNGGKAMPPYGDILTSREVGDLVSYLRSKRKAAPLPGGQPASENSTPR